VADAEVMEPELWKKNGWIAKVIKNPDDDGWAVEMTRIGDDEPALVGPWTMGRGKKNPKPLDQPAFLTLVKTATEVLRRHEQSPGRVFIARSRSSPMPRRRMVRRSAFAPTSTSFRTTTIPTRSSRSSKTRPTNRSAADA
jgi:hypothetical protein